MADFKQQLLALLGGSNSLVECESSVNERTVSADNGTNIVIQQRKEVEREIRKVQPQLDFTSPDFCSGEQIKLFNKLQLLPAVPYNVVKLEYRTIRNAKCLIATAQSNFGDPIEGHEDFPPMVEFTVSNKWSKLLSPLIGTSDVKYIIATRCNLETEQTFGDKAYATMKFDFAKTLVKKHMQVTDDETVMVNCEKPDLTSDTVKSIIRKASNVQSRVTYEIHRKNLIWNESKYQEAMSRTSLKRKRDVSVTVDIYGDVVSKRDKATIDEPKALSEALFDE